jgi:heme oxygenase
MGLRELTSEKHRYIEQLPFSQRMVKGELGVEEYLSYLYQMKDVFHAIETKINLPENLKRQPNLFDDIEELEEQLLNGGYVYESTKKYTSYLNSLDEDSLWCHIYLNYMALLFGGQIIKQNIPGNGKLYDFDDVPSIMTLIRGKQKDEWADEVNNGYDFLISIYDELQRKP